jgi:hypothetical protein
VTDRVFRDKESGMWRCIVNGKVYGDWSDRAIAKAGMRVEQQRATARDAMAARERTLDFERNALD